MRNPNGYGSVAKLSGKRSRPYIVKKTRGWDDRGFPIIEIIGYAETREAGLLMLAQYNNDPWDIANVKITLQHLFDLWYKKKAAKLGESNRASLKSAYKHCKHLSDHQYRLIKAFQMQDCIDNCGKSYATQAIIKNLWSHLDKFALEMDIINRCYSDLLTSTPIPQTDKKPFTDDEIDTVWKHKDDPWVDSVLVFLYSGWRISELLNLKKTDVNLQDGTMKGGTKTKAGKNRIVPIHSKIRSFIEQRMDQPGEFLFSFNGKRCSDFRYRAIWRSFMEDWGMNHTPHECRHTFRTKLDSAGANQKCMDLLMGHASKDTGNRVYNHKTLADLKETIELIQV